MVVGLSTWLLLLVLMVVGLSTWLLVLMVVGLST
jgi:hypothetical protein